MGGDSLAGLPESQRHRPQPEGGLTTSGWSCQDQERRTPSRSPDDRNKGVAGTPQSPGHPSPDPPRSWSWRQAGVGQVREPSTRTLHHCSWSKATPVLRLQGDTARAFVVGGRFSP